LIGHAGTAIQQKPFWRDPVDRKRSDGKTMNMSRLKLTGGPYCEPPVFTVPAPTIGRILENNASFCSKNHVNVIK
jgi:hypothetical protein